MLQQFTPAENLNLAVRTGWGERGESSCPSAFPVSSHNADAAIGRIYQRSGKGEQHSPRFSPVLTQPPRGNLVGAGAREVQA